MLGGRLRFPSKGVLRDKEQYVVTLDGFTTFQETEPPNRPSLSKVKRAIRYIDLVLSMEPKVNPNMTVKKEDFHFKRNIFIANEYPAQRLIFIVSTSLMIMGLEIGFTNLLFNVFSVHECVFRASSK